MMEKCAIGIVGRRAKQLVIRRWKQRNRCNNNYIIHVLFYLVTFWVGLCLRLAELKFLKISLLCLSKKCNLYISTHARPTTQFQWIQFPFLLISFFLQQYKQYKIKGEIGNWIRCVNHVPLHVWETNTIDLSNPFIFFFFFNLKILKIKIISWNFKGCGLFRKPDVPAINA